MSLKIFHIVFISASILLTFGFCSWAIRNSNVLYASLSFLFGAALIVYGFKVFKKL